MKSTEEKIRIIKEGVRYRARKRYHQGNLQNPYGKYLELDYLSLKAGMCVIYDDEIKRLVKERICPCCGQPTMGDIDF